MTIHTTNQSKYKCGVATCSAVAEVLLNAGWLSYQPADGAAYTLRSSSARGAISISLYETSGLSIKVESGRCSRTWQLPSANGGYCLLANPYGLFLAPVEHGVSGLEEHETHGLFLSVPAIEDGIDSSAISTCVLLVELGASLAVGTTHRSFLWFNDTELADSEFAPGDTSWGVMQWQQLGVEGLLTTMGQPLKTPAALFLPHNGHGECLGVCPVRRAGYFWDSIVVSEYMARGALVDLDGASWIVTLSQNSGDGLTDTSTAGSMLWRIDEAL